MKTKKTFRFYRNTKNEFIWTDNKTFRAVWKNPQIQAYDDYVLMHEKNGILYYYYDFAVFERDYYKKWHKRAEIRTHDFPAAEALCKMLPKLMQTNIKEYAERWQTRDNHFVYHKSESTAGSLGDDFYDIRRFHHTGSREEWYQMYLGAEHLGVRIDSLCKGDLLELHKCISAFVEYSKEVHDNQVRISWEYNQKRHICKNGKFYVRNLEQDDCYEACFCVGDTFDSFDTLPEDEENPESCLEYPHSELLAVQDNSIILKTYDGEKKISVSKIQYVWGDTDKKLHWSIPEMAKEFSQTLSDDEKKAFAEKSVSELAEFYFDMIENRYALYREEHGLVGGYEFSGEERDKMAFEAVKQIISRIKELLI